MVVFVWNSLVLVVCASWAARQCEAQWRNSTHLDTQLLQPVLEMRKLLQRFSARDDQIQDIFGYNKRKGKLQKLIPSSQAFFCDPLGPGKRSPIRPTSVHKIRPGDVDIIAAIGDSLTAANGAMSSNLLHLFIENRSVAWAMGGRGNWRKYLTLPNILREFNPRLYGFSTDDRLAVERGSKFNVAEPMTFYDDMLFQARLLAKRMQRDPAVDMQNDWKLVTVFLGNNDICTKICELDDPLQLLAQHEEFVLRALRYLRDNVPRLMVNWVPLPNLVNLAAFKGTPPECYLAQRFECRCIYNGKITAKQLRLYADIISRLQAMQAEIVNRDEFDSDTFTVNLQPFTVNVTFPTAADGNTDLRFYAHDCFHFSQLGHATAANALWNNMLQPVGRKQTDWYPVFRTVECPTKQRPYFFTRRNSV